MRNAILAMLLLLCIAVCSPASFAQSDPGVPDSMLITGGPLVIGRSVPLNFTVKNDETLAAFAAYIKMISQNGGFGKLDSVVYVDRLADPTVLPLRFYAPHINGVTPDSFTIYAANAGGENLSVGSTPVFLMYFTGLIQGRMSLMPFTAFTGDSPGIFLAGDPSSSLVRVSLPAVTVDIIKQAEPPFITLDETIVRAVAGSAIQIPISYGSSLGLETSVVIESAVEVDSSLVAPSTLPSLIIDSAPRIEWVTSSSDIGIWKLTLKATDSNNMSSRAAVEVQLAADQEHLVPLTTRTHLSDYNATTLLTGNFDSDPAPELFATGGGNEISPCASLYEISEDGLEVLFSHDWDNPKFGAQAGFINSDSRLDVVTTSWASSYLFTHMIQTYLGEGGTFTTVQEGMEYGFAKGATLGEFTGDSKIDYAIAARSSMVIFKSDGDGTFSDPKAFAISDTALCLNSADFNGDGRDDLALGTRRGVQIYLQNSKHGFSLVANYPQDYGSVDLDITNSGSDFNSDDKFDLCIATPSVGGAKSKLMIYYGNGDGTFSQTEIRNINGQILANCVGDFNNDTELDIAFVNGSSRYVGIIFGDGNGNFESEIRYPIPGLNPRLIDCLDYDLDGDLDLVASATGISTENAFYLFTNEKDPPGYSAGHFEVNAQDNVQIAILAPGGGQLKEICNSIPAAAMYKRDLNSNDVLDSYASLGVIESGEYIIKALPKPDQPTSSTFNLEYVFGGQQFSLARNCPMQSAGFEFGVPLDANAVAPRPGSFVGANIGSFRWQGSGEFDFQLATDILFENIVHQQVVAGNNLPFAADLGYSDTTIYFWRVKPASGTQFGKLYSFNVTGTATAVEGESESILPGSYSLAQNYPNPFNPVTRIEFILPRAEKATVRVTNVLGETVTTLLDEVIPAGRYAIEWRGVDQAGKEVPSGVYFYSLRAGGFVEVRKMVLLK